MRLVVCEKDRTQKNPLPKQSHGDCWRSGMSQSASRYAGSEDIGGGTTPTYNTTFAQFVPSKCDVDHSDADGTGSIIERTARRLAAEWSRYESIRSLAAL